MKAKDEAKELLNHFYSESDFGNDDEIAKQVAFSYVQDKIKTFQLILKHYKKVKQEIEKL
jgi:hypothetical protein